MTHDPLCAFAPCDCYKDGSGIHSCGTNACQCKLIAKVRADEAHKAVGRYLEERRRVVLAEIMSR